MDSAKKPRVRLMHILSEIDGILAVTAGLASNDILNDYKTIRATERAIQIISEAAKELPEPIQQLEPQIPWKAIARIGNYLRHEYYRINLETLSEILDIHLPQLRLAIMRLLNVVQD